MNYEWKDEISIIALVETILILLPIVLLVMILL